MKRVFLLLTIIMGSIAAQAQTPDSINPKLLKFDAPITISLADKHVFVDLTGTIIDTTGHSGPYMAEIDFYKMIAEHGTGQQNATINQLIRQAGMRPGKWKE